MMKAAASANLDFAQELVGVKSPSEAMELWTSHARKQFEAFTAHTKELAELAQKVATETAEPIKASASKLFKPRRLIGRQGFRLGKARALSPGFFFGALRNDCAAKAGP